MGAYPDAKEERGKSARVDIMGRVRRDALSRAVLFQCPVRMSPLLVHSSLRGSALSNTTAQCHPHQPTSRSIPPRSPRITCHDLSCLTLLDRRFFPASSASAAVYSVLLPQMKCQSVSILYDLKLMTELTLSLSHRLRQSTFLSYSPRLHLRTPSDQAIDQTRKPCRQSRSRVSGSRMTAHRSVSCCAPVTTPYVNLFTVSTQTVGTRNA